MTYPPITAAVATINGKRYPAHVGSPDELFIRGLHWERFLNALPGLEREAIIGRGELEIEVEGDFREWDL
jgi:hypothetical protein